MPPSISRKRAAGAANLDDHALPTKTTRTGSSAGNSTKQPAGDTASLIRLLASPPRRRRSAWRAAPPPSPDLLKAKLTDPSIIELVRPQRWARVGDGNLSLFDKPQDKRTLFVVGPSRQEFMAACTTRVHSARKIEKLSWILMGLEVHD